MAILKSEIIKEATGMTVGEIMDNARQWLADEKPHVTTKEENPITSLAKIFIARFNITIKEKPWRSRTHERGKYDNFNTLAESKLKENNTLKEIKDALTAIFLKVYREIVPFPKPSP